MPAGMWLGAFFALCVFGAGILEIAGFFGFIQVDYSKALIPPQINFIAMLPVVVTLVVSVIGFFKKAQWSRITAIGIWPLVGIYSIFKNWWLENFVPSTIIQIIIITTIITAISWRYFFRRENIVKYFNVAKNT